MVIAIDYDGTIADTNAEKAHWIAEHIGEAVFPWQCNRSDCVPIIGLDAYERMGNYVYECESSLQAAPVFDALGAVHTLAQWAELHIVTARPESRVGSAREWLKNNGVFSCFSAIHSSSGTSKSVVCSEIGANVLIDDDIRHLKTVKSDGLLRILIRDGRTEDGTGMPGLRCCGCWQEIVSFLNPAG